MLKRFTRKSRPLKLRSLTPLLRLVKVGQSLQNHVQFVVLRGRIRKRADLNSCSGVCLHVNPVVVYGYAFSEIAVTNANELLYNKFLVVFYGFSSAVLPVETMSEYYTLLLESVDNRVCVRPLRCGKYNQLESSGGRL